MRGRSVTADGGLASYRHVRGSRPFADGRAEDRSSLQSGWEPFAGPASRRNPRPDGGWLPTCARGPRPAITGRRVRRSRVCNSRRNWRSCLRRRSLGRRHYARPLARRTAQPCRGTRRCRRSTLQSACWSCALRHCPPRSQAVEYRCNGCGGAGLDRLGARTTSLRTPLGSRRDASFPSTRATRFTRTHGSRRRPQSRPLRTWRNAICNCGGPTTNRRRHSSRTPFIPGATRTTAGLGAGSPLPHHRAAACSRPRAAPLRRRSAGRHIARRRRAGHTSSCSPSRWTSRCARGDRGG